MSNKTMHIFEITFHFLLESVGGNFVDERCAQAGIYKNAKNLSKSCETLWK